MDAPSVTTRSALTNTPDNAWAVRGDYWLKRLNPPRQREPKRRRKANRPLVLSGHGIRLKVEAGTLLITCGFTHYPQSREQYRFFNGDRQMPSRIVILDGDGSITLDALEWLSGQCVPLVQIDWKGTVNGVGGTFYAAKPDFVKRQLDMKDSGKGFEFMKRLVVDKLNNCVGTIQSVPVEHPDINARISKLRDYAERIKQDEFETDITLLSAEAVAAVAYFQCWYHYELRWRGTRRKPIPPEWKSLNTRVGKNGNSNKFATHPINAILNYAYGVLENQVKGLITVAGLDPTIPVFHAQNRSGVALVHDLMEPVRPVMDRHVLKFIYGRTFSPDDFVLNKDGVVRLHPQFARFLVKSIQDITEIEQITTKNINKLIN
jgi:CRISPR-associated protein Cas1